MTTTPHGPEQGALTFTDPSPLRASDRRLILGAFVAVDRMYDGHINPNRVREQLVDLAGDLRVRPRALSGAYRVLRLAGVLHLDGTTINEDRRGGNYGKVANRYRTVNRTLLHSMWEAAS